MRQKGSANRLKSSEHVKKIKSFFSMSLIIFKSINFQHFTLYLIMLLYEISYSKFCKLYNRLEKDPYSWQYLLFHWIDDPTTSVNWDAIMKREFPYHGFLPRASILIRNVVKIVTRPRNYVEMIRLESARRDLTCKIDLD